LGPKVTPAIFKEKEKKSKKEKKKAMKSPPECAKDKEPLADKTHVHQPHRDVDYQSDVSSLSNSSNEQYGGGKISHHTPLLSPSSKKAD